MMTTRSGYLNHNVHSTPLVNDCKGFMLIFYSSIKYNQQTWIHIIVRFGYSGMSLCRSIYFLFEWKLWNWKKKEEGKCLRCSIGTHIRIRMHSHINCFTMQRRLWSGIWLVLRAWLTFHLIAFDDVIFFFF